VALVLTLQFAPTRNASTDKHQSDPVCTRWALFEMTMRVQYLKCKDENTSSKETGALTAPGSCSAMTAF
jgi:hypothetical protein